MKKGRIITISFVSAVILVVVLVFTMNVSKTENTNTSNHIESPDDAAMALPPADSAMPPVDSAMSAAETTTDTSRK